jgi:hypothetical protein
LFRLWLAQRCSGVAPSTVIVVRIEPFFATAARVIDVDRRRAESLGYVAGSSGVSDAEANNALRRNNENADVEIPGREWGAPPGLRPHCDK